MSDRRIVNVAAPVAGTDAVNLTYFSANAATLGLGSVAATADKWLIRGSSGQASAAWLESGTGTPAGSGLVRAANNVTVWAARGAGAYDVPGATVNASDIIVHGDATRTAGHDLNVKTGGLVRVYVNSSLKLTFNGPLVLMTAGTPTTLGHVGMDTTTGRILLYVGSASVSVMTYADIISLVMPKAADATLLAASGIVIQPRVNGNKTLVAVYLFSSGNLTASDTDYTTYTAYVWRGGGLTSIGALTTKTIGAGGTGDWAFGSLFSFPIGVSALVDADAVVISQSKTGLGVIAPVTTFQMDYKHAV